MVFIIREQLGEFLCAKKRRALRRLFTEKATCLRDWIHDLWILQSFNKTYLLPDLNTSLTFLLLPRQTELIQWPPAPLKNSEADRPEGYRNLMRGQLLAVQNLKCTNRINQQKLISSLPSKRTHLALGTPPCDWSTKLTPPSRPIKCKTKTKVIGSFPFSRTSTSLLLFTSRSNWLLALFFFVLISPQIVDNS